MDFKRLSVSLLLTSLFFTYVYAISTPDNCLTEFGNDIIYNASCKSSSVSFLRPFTNYSIIFDGYNFASNIPLTLDFDACKIVLKTDLYQNVTELCYGFRYQLTNRSKSEKPFPTTFTVNNEQLSFLNYNEPCNAKFKPVSGGFIAKFAFQFDTLLRNLNFTIKDAKIYREDSDSDITPASATSITFIVVASVIVLVVLICIGVLAFIWYRKRLAKKRNEATTEQLSKEPSQDPIEDFDYIEVKNTGHPVPFYNLNKLRAMDIQTIIELTEKNPLTLAERNILEKIYRQQWVINRDLKRHQAPHMGMVEANKDLMTRLETMRVIIAAQTPAPPKPDVPNLS